MIHEVPTDRQYSDTHEWFLIEGDIVTIGITQHAADALTDVTYVELRPVGTKIDIHGSIGDIESVKATSEILVPMAGEIIEINLELVNDDAFGDGWLVKLKADSIDMDNFISAKKYDQLNSGDKEKT